MAQQLFYPVEILNDDTTPFSIVVQLITEVFDYSKDDALELTTKIHEEGSVVLGTYIYEIAETKVAEVERINKAHNLDIKIQLDTSADEMTEEEFEITRANLEKLMESLRKEEDGDAEE